MRILWHANLNAPWSCSGYGTQTSIWVPRLASLGHHMAVSSFYGIEHATTMWEGVPVYPVGCDPLGNDVLPGHFTNHKADLLISLMDAWGLDAQLVAGWPAAAWMPVDCTPLSGLDNDWLQASGARPVTFSRHGETTLLNAGYDPLYVPHGIPCDVFKPASEDDRSAVRERMGIPDGAFVVGINAANKDPVRKAFPEQFAAFGMFRQAHPEAFLLVHSLAWGPGAALNLGRLAAACGIPEQAIGFSNRHKYLTGAYTMADMAVWYSALDVLSNCSFGGGFELALLEAQACGIPVVATDHSAMTEMCHAGILVGSEPHWHDGHGAWWAKPHIGEIVQAYKTVYDAGVDTSRGRQFALGYDADVVLRRYWVPALEELERQEPKTAKAAA